MSNQTVIRKHLNTLVLIGLLLIAKNSFGQSSPGILGKKWIIGYEPNWKFVQGDSETDQPIVSRILHKVGIEKLTDGKANIGFSIITGKATSSFNHYNHNYDLRYKNVEYFKNDTMNYIVYIEGMHQLNTTNIELSIKRYFNFNQMRNLGWYFNYKIGMIFMKSQLLNPTLLTVHDARDEASYSYYKYYKENFSKIYRSNAPYIGIDCGKTFPLIGTRLLFNNCVSWNITFNKTKSDQSMESTMNKITGRNVARRHLLTYNIGLSYVL